MKNLKYKVGILLTILFVCLLGSFHTSHGKWAETTPNFTKYSGPKNFWKNGSYSRPSGNTLTISSEYKISNVNDKKKRTFQGKDLHVPEIDVTSGIFCVEHGIKGKEKTWPIIKRNVIVNGSKVYIDYGTEEQKIYSKEEDIKATKIYAYILTHGADYEPNDNEEHRGKQPVQQALWRECGPYMESDISSFTAITSWVDDKEDVGSKALTDQIQNEATDYANVPLEDCKVTCSKNYTWKENANDSSQYIIGPFIAEFPQYKDGKSKLIFADEEGSTVNGKTKDSKLWNYCNKSGKTINEIEKDQEFYLKVEKSLIGNQDLTFKLKAKRLVVDAEWWEIQGISGKQAQIFLTSAIRRYENLEDEVKISLPSLTITKTDKTTGKPLQGVQFKIRNGSKYIKSINAGGFPTYGTKAQAKIFTTDKNGKLPTIKVAVGTYYAEEVSVGNNWQYEAGVTFTIKVKAGKNQVKLTNQKVYINLSGYVWEDIEWEPDKEGDSNGLYRDNNYDKEDKLLQNVTVKLIKNGQPISFKNSNGNEITEVKTDKDGKYKMYGVRIEDLDKLSIEFTYNGINYKSVTPNIGKNNGSKAAEGGKRTEFNQKYANIIPGAATNSQGNKTATLNYTRKDYESSVIYGSNSVYGYQGQEFPINGTDQNFLIQATTSGTYDLRGGKTVDQIRASGLEEISNINLGVSKREQPQLKVLKDINSAKVSINGVQHIYKYSDRANTNSQKMKELYEAVKQQTGTEISSPYQIPPKVKFETPYANMSYTRALYPSDVYYEAPKGQEDKNLRVKVIYQIGVSNQSSSLKAIVNEIDDYYDSKYIVEGTKIKVGRKIDARTGEVSQEGNDKIEYELQQINNNNYRKIHIKNINLEAGSSNQKDGNYIYVQLEVEQNQIKQIVTENENNNEKVKLDNIAEITSYSVKDQNNAPYAGIDQKSAPGNVDLNNQKTYEADTDKAPGLKLVLGEERKTSGKVFIDKVKEENGFNANGVNYAQVRQGSGSYEEGEVGIKDVVVELVYPDKTTEVKTYNKEGKWSHVKAITNDQGEFTIEGFIPDNYILKYTWGGQTYYKDEKNPAEEIRVQDYKGTIYNEPSREKNLEWYKLNNRYSDAKDSYETREKIDNQSSMITNSNKEAINQYQEDSKIKVQGDNGEESYQPLIRTMDSYTPEFRVNVEYELEPTNGEEESINYLQNMDFGIVERAKQQLELNKNITRAKVNLSNGNILIDAKIKDGKLEDTIKYATYMPNSATNGQLKLEVDSEILQNAILEIEYELKVSNKSELDYKTQDFYWYGQGYGQTLGDLVALSADKIIDYLDNNLSNNQTKEQESEWKTYTAEEKQKLIKKEGTEQLNGLLAENLKNIVNNTNTIMETEELNDQLKPTQNNGTKAIKLKAYKMLPSVLKEEDTNFGNDAEIIKITKTGGSTITTTPGNYDPSKGPPSEVDESTAEAVTIVPPTGLDMNVIAYTLLAISSLGILTTGILLIRKLVLK